MRATPKNLWRVPAYLPYLQPKLTKAIVSAAERQLRVKLPRAYLAALKMQNGGYLRRTHHPSELAPVDCIDGIGPRFPSLLRHDWDDIKSYTKEEGLKKPRRIDELLPFCGNGHYHYCFDYRKSGREAEPRVTYIDVETFDIDDVLAPDFETFLSQLSVDEPGAMIGLCTRGDVAAALSAATGFTFEEQGDEDTGYRVLRAKLPGDGHWAWATSNRVRLGFARSNEAFDSSYAWMRDEHVDRYPEHADCGWFLRTDFETPAGKKVVAALRKLPFATRRVEPSP